MSGTDRADENAPKTSTVRLPPARFYNGGERLQHSAHFHGLQQVVLRLKQQDVFLCYTRRCSRYFSTFSDRVFDSLSSTALHGVLSLVYVLILPRTGSTIFCEHDWALQLETLFGESARMEFINWCAGAQKQRLLHLANCIIPRDIVGDIAVVWLLLDLTWWHDGGALVFIFEICVLYCA